MNAPAHGFAFMRKPAALAKAYDQSPCARARADYLAALRNAVPDIDPARYRGVGRYPLNADYNYRDPGWQWDKGSPKAVEELGTLAVAEVLGDWRGTGEEWLIDGPWLLPDVSSVRQVLSVIERPDAYEVVEVALHPAYTRAEALGFDVGYWASGNFSLICDTVVWPLWHPAPPEELSTLAKLVGGLNEAVLFPDASAASAFREMYREQSWAEGDDGDEFQIIQVARANLECGA